MKISKRIHFKYLIAVIVMFFLYVSPVNAEMTKWREEEYFNKAIEANISKDYQLSAIMLEQLLTLYPNTQNEDVYWNLTDIYDNNLGEYPKAIPVYQKYLHSFPGGRFYNVFNERLAYLEKNQKDWDVIRDYKKITNTYYTRSGPENLKLMEQLFTKHPYTILTPDIELMLIGEYFKAGRYREAESYIHKYLATFPENGKSEAEKITAYKTYSDIYRNTHKFRKAKAILKEGKIDQLSPPLYTESVKVIQKEFYRWLGLILSIGCIIAIIILMVIVQPWPKFTQLNLKTVILGICLIAVCTLGPMAAVAARGYGVDRTFPILAIGSSLALLLIQWLAPVSRKYNRTVYLIVCFILVLSVVYISFYWTDRLSVFYQKPEFSQM